MSAYAARSLNQTQLPSASPARTIRGYGYGSVQETPANTWNLQHLLLFSYLSPKERFDFKLGNNWVANARTPEQSLPLPQPSLSQQQALVSSAAS